jgi:hypothetical protein
MSRVLAYIFPFVIIAMEIGLRRALHSDTSWFVGPALSSAAAALLVPLITLKDKTSALGAELQAELKRRKITATSRADRIVSPLCFLLLLCVVAAWIWCVVLADNKDAGTLLGFQRPLVIGLICYFIGVIAVEAKEAV